MTRDLAAWSLGLCLLAAGPGGPARAEDLPVRKAGLWEIKMARTGSPLPEMTMQHCTDESVDRDMNNMVSPMAKQICSKQDLQKTATGYVSDSVCSVGGVSMVSLRRSLATSIPPTRSRAPRIATLAAKQRRMIP